MDVCRLGFEWLAVGLLLTIAAGCGVDAAQDDTRETKDTTNKRVAADKQYAPTDEKTIQNPVSTDTRPNDVQDGDAETLPSLRVKMPGESYKGELPPMTKEQATVRDALRRDLVRLAGVIGERNLDNPEKYGAAALFIEKSLTDMGYKVENQSYRIGDHRCVNLSATVAGHKKADEMVVIGAHYDSLAGTPGANDNGSGVVATLALARMFVEHKPSRTLRLVFFANEEPPYFQTADMGSVIYAKACNAREDNVVGMLSIETIGYYSDEKESQHYPPPFSAFYPSTGNFIAFVGNVKSDRLVATCVGSFRKHAKFPSEGAAVPGIIQGVGWSDHWSFWQVGYPALMVTDTAPFRYPHYHQASDTTDKIDYDRMARVVTGLRGVVSDLIDAD